MSDKTRKIGEMTYHECAMIGNMMKARALAQKNHEATLQHRLESLQQFESVMAKLTEKIQLFNQLISQNFLAKPVVFVVQSIILPAISFIQNIPKFVMAVKEFVPNIMDKLSAIYGEAKAFLNKKLEEFVKAVKTGKEWIFKIFKKRNSDDDDTKIDDDKKIFNLKTILHKVKEKFNRKKDKKDERSTENQ